MIMLIVAVLGLVAAVIYFRRRTTRGGALSAILGFVVSVAIALIMLLRAWALHCGRHIT